MMVFYKKRCNLVTIGKQVLDWKTATIQDYIYIARVQANW